LASFPNVGLNLLPKTKETCLKTFGFTKTQLLGFTFGSLLQNVGAVH